MFTKLESAKYYCRDLKERFNINDLIILKIDNRLTVKLLLRYEPKIGGESSDFGAVYTDIHFCFIFYNRFHQMSITIFKFKINFIIFYYFLTYLVMLKDHF